MSTATKPRTRNASIKSAGRTPITPSKTTFSLMVKVQHTTSPTITITAKKDFSLEAVTIDTRTGEKSADTSVKVLAGTELVLVASSFSGFYYIGRVTQTQVICTCGHYQCTKPHDCKHQSVILATHQARTERQNREIAAAFVDASAAIESEAEELMDEDSKLERWTAQELAKSDKLSDVGAPETPTTCLQERLQTASDDERRAIWKQVQKDERVSKKEHVATYWTKVHEYRSQAAV